MLYLLAHCTVNTAPHLQLLLATFLTDTNIFRQGTDATLTLKNGEQFSGIFSGSSLESPTRSVYILKMVKRIRLASHQQTNGNTELADEYIGDGEDHFMAFDVQETAELAVDSVDTANANAAQNGKSIGPQYRLHVPALTTTRLTRLVFPHRQRNFTGREDASRA